MTDLQVIDFVHDDPPFDAWSLIRNVLSHGVVIEQDSRALGRTYEQHSARLDTASRELADRLKPHLRSTA